MSEIQLLFILWNLELVYLFQFSFSRKLIEKNNIEIPKNFLKYLFLTLYPVALYVVYKNRNLQEWGVKFDGEFLENIIVFDGKNQDEKYRNELIEKGYIFFIIRSKKDLKKIMPLYPYL